MEGSICSSKTETVTSSSERKHAMPCDIPLHNDNFPSIQQEFKCLIDEDNFHNNKCCCNDNSKGALLCCEQPSISVSDIVEVPLEQNNPTATFSDVCVCNEALLDIIENNICTLNKMEREHITSANIDQNLSIPSEMKVMDNTDSIIIDSSSVIETFDSPSIAKSACTNKEMSTKSLTEIPCSRLSQSDFINVSENLESALLTSLGNEFNSDTDKMELVTLSAVSNSISLQETDKLSMTSSPVGSPTVKLENEKHSKVLNPIYSETSEMSRYKSELEIFTDKKRIVTSACAGSSLVMCPPCSSCEDQIFKNTQVSCDHADCKVNNNIGCEKLTGKLCDLNKNQEIKFNFTKEAYPNLFIFKGNNSEEPDDNELTIEESNLDGMVSVETADVNGVVEPSNKNVNDTNGVKIELSAGSKNLQKRPVISYGSSDSKVTSSANCNDSDGSLPNKSVFKHFDLSSPVVAQSSAPSRKIFLSENAEENDDNNNPKWEKWRSLSTDEQRYSVVRDIWKNACIPNPRFPLTHYNWRAMNNLPVCYQPIGYPRRSYSHLQGGSIQILFDKCLQNAQGFYDKDLAYLYKWFNMEVANLRNRLRQRLDSSHPKTHTHLIKSHDAAMSDLSKRCNVEKSILSRNFKLRCESVKSASEELKLVYRFYNGLHKESDQVGSSTYLKSTEIRKWAELEDILTSYNDYYNQ